MKTEEDKAYRLLCGDLRDVAKTKSGRRLLWYVLGCCNLYDNSFTGNSTTFYNEGRRSVGLEILTIMEDADPTMYPRMLLENIETPMEKENE